MTTRLRTAPRVSPHPMLSGTYQRLIEDEEDYQDAIQALRMLRRVIPMLLSLPESSPSTIMLMVEDWRRCTLAAACDAVRSFVERHWHVLPDDIRDLIDNCK